MKKWEVGYVIDEGDVSIDVAQIVSRLIANRGLTAKKDIEQFLHPKSPYSLTAADVGIDKQSLQKALTRIKDAIAKKEQIIVYADYDADGITAGTIMWETLHKMGASVMPYIPHRVEEGYGLSKKGIANVVEQYHPTLIITVDHGITGWEKVEYARSLGIDVIVTDHHTKPEKLPDCTIVHTTSLCGAGVSWFVAKELCGVKNDEHIALAAIGTIADLVPLVGANRSIVKFGLAAINKTSRVGLDALFSEAGLTKGALTTYDISHALAPRLNAAGRLVHAMDALRLLCTGQADRAMILARKLNLTNKDRQQLTVDTALHAKQSVDDKGPVPKLLFVAHDTYNQGIIGLVAGKLVETYYRPSVVLAQGELISKASARSISGFNIVEAIRSCSDLLIDVGGHPMAAGFTVETKNLEALGARLLSLAEAQLDDDKLVRTLRIDVEMPLGSATVALWEALSDFEPFGFGSVEPVFSTRGVEVVESRLVGKDGKHMKLKLRDKGLVVDAIAFGLGELYPSLRPEKPIDVAYSIDMNVWNGRSSLQLKVKDIHLS
jgi:single-stranded-DNA-specific exonuclease